MVNATVNYLYCCLILVVIENKICSCARIMRMTCSRCTYLLEVAYGVNFFDSIVFSSVRLVNNSAYKNIKYLNVHRMRNTLKKHALCFQTEPLSTTLDREPSNFTDVDERWIRREGWDFFLFFTSFKLLFLESLLKIRKKCIFQLLDSLTFEGKHDTLPSKILKAQRMPDFKQICLHVIPRMHVWRDALLKFIIKVRA